MALTAKDFMEIKNSNDLCIRKSSEETFELVSKYMKKKIKTVSSLKWEYVKYNDDNAKKQIPLGRKGIYAFIAMHESNIFPHHGYVMYIGLAGKGKNPKRGLRQRYQEYMRKSYLMKRSPDVKKMFSFHYQILHFFYAEVNPSKLEKLETELIKALLPPANDKKKIHDNYKKAVGKGAKPKATF